MKFNKKSILTTGLAVVLAAILVIGGGTFAYLQNKSADVTNNFNTNNVLVELTETGDRQYNIIPGTEEIKDPKVTVKATADSYVYAIVTDNLEGLVKYEIASGWNLLDGWNGAHTKVYYREVGAADAEKEFYVLKDNKVKYDAALQNNDMIEADGTLKDGLNLTFSAYAIQKDGFADAKTAFETGYQSVSTSDALTDALASGKTAVLSQDVTIPSQIEASGDVNIIGNGNTLTSPNGYNARIINVTGQTEPVVVNIKDAVLEGPTSGSYTRGISLYNNQNVTVNIEDSSVSANYYALNIAASNTNATLNIKNSTITGWAAINMHSSNTQANFENCTLIGTNVNSGPTDGFATVVLSKTTDNPDPEGAHDCTLTFKDCRIEANQQGTAKQYLMSVRTINTTVKIINCTFFVNGEQIDSTVEALSPYVSVYPTAYESFNFTIE